MGICITKLKKFFADQSWCVLEEMGASFSLSLEEGGRSFHMGLQSLEALPGFPLDLQQVSLVQICFLLGSEVEGNEELLSACNLLNKSTLFPGFGWDGVAKRVFYRYAWPVRAEGDLSALPGLLNHLLLQVEAYEGVLQPIADGQLSVDALLEETSALIH